MMLRVMLRILMSSVDHGKFSLGLPSFTLNLDDHAALDSVVKLATNLLQA